MLISYLQHGFRSRKRCQKFLTEKVFWKPSSSSLSIILTLMLLWNCFMKTLHTVREDSITFTYKLCCLQEFLTKQPESIRITARRQWQGSLRNKTLSVRAQALLSYQCLSSINYQHFRRWEDKNLFMWRVDCNSNPVAIFINNSLVIATNFHTIQSHNF